MKQIKIRKAEYLGEAGSKTFNRTFQEHILLTLYRRGMLTDKQFDKSRAMLKGRYG